MVQPTKTVRNSLRPMAQHWVVAHAHIAADPLHSFFISLSRHTMILDVVLVHLSLPPHGFLLQIRPSYAFLDHEAELLSRSTCSAALAASIEVHSLVVASLNSTPAHSSNASLPPFESRMSLYHASYSLYNSTGTSIFGHLA